MDDDDDDEDDVKDDDGGDADELCALQDMFVFNRPLCSKSRSKSFACVLVS